MSKNDITLEEALKPQQGVLCMQNSIRGLVKTTNFGILVKRDRRAFNLDFVNVNNKPINYWALNSKKAAEILRNEKLSKDLQFNEQKKKDNNSQTNTEPHLTNYDLSNFAQSDLVKLIKHSSASRFLRKRGDISTVIGLNHPRLTIGKFVKSCDGKPILQPFDSKLPKMYVAKRSTSGLDSDFAHVVTIDEWPENSEFATGKILESYEVSNLDYDFVLTKSLIINEIDTRNYSNEFENRISRSFYIDENDFVGRLDLRHETVFTIDPKEAEDLDDALSCKILKDGNYEVGIHIADVSHFVKPNTDIDEMARKRNLSSYLPKKYIPMLPKTLRDLCSLTPGKDRLTISLIFKVTDEGIVYKEHYQLSVINSVKKFSYEDAEKIITANECDRKPEHIALRLLHKLTQILKNKRRESNAFYLQKDCSKFKAENLDEEMDVTEILEPRKESEMIVEEMMILSNSKVASNLLKQYPNCTLLRVQPPIADKLLLNLQMLCSETVYNVNTSNMKDLQKSIVDIADDKKLSKKQIIANTLIHLIQKSNKRAKYICSGTNNVNTLHSALNTTYTHFTSPIRRYADIVVHRLLKCSLQGKSSDTAIINHETAMIAELCNSRKKAVQNVTKKCYNFLLKLYIEKNGPFTESSVVLAIHKNYFSVFVGRFSLVVKIKYTQIDAIQSFNVLTENKKPGLYKAVLKFGHNDVTLEPLSVIPITLQCIANDEKRYFELIAKLDTNKN